MTGHLPLSLVDHVQFIRINSSLAKGPTLGRSLNAGMYAGQDYFMQIDSHTKFAPGWDVRLVRQYRWGMDLLLQLRCPSFLQVNEKSGRV